MLPNLLCVKSARVRSPLKRLAIADFFSGLASLVSICMARLCFLDAAIATNPIRDTGNGPDAQIGPVLVRTVEERANTIVAKAEPRLRVIVVLHQELG